MHISVALCTYNGEKFIREQIESILSQTHPVHEIVISDDGSTDDTLNILQEYVSTASLREQINIVLLKNSSPVGISANFQACIAATSCDWVLLCDQDDIWHKDKVEILIGEITNHSTAKLFCTNAELVDELGFSLGYSLFHSLKISTKEIDLLQSNRAFEALLRRNLATGATMLVNKSVFRKAVPFPPNWIHDEWLSIVAAYESEFMLINLKTIDYRQHSQNSIGARRLSLRRRISKYREPRNERNEHLVLRAEELLNFIEINCDVTPGEAKNKFAKLARNYLGFHQNRLRLNSLRIHRFAPVIKYLMQGEYSKFSRGCKDALKDLIQPDCKHTAN